MISTDTYPCVHYRKVLKSFLLFLLVRTANAFTVLAGVKTKQAANVAVTPARIPQDLAQIQKCRMAAFDKPVAQLLDSQQRFVNGTAVAEGRATCLVARGRNEVILGTADISKTDPIQRKVRITNVFVTPEARGQGIAKQLLQAIEDEAIAQGATKLYLQVYTNNKPAYTLYQRNDFNTYGIHRILAQISMLTEFPFLVEMEKDLD